MAEPMLHVFMALANTSNRFYGFMKGGDNMAKNQRCRSAVTGKFVSKEYADKNPKTTVKETVKKSK